MTDNAKLAEELEGQAIGQGVGSPLVRLPLQTWLTIIAALRKDAAGQEVQRHKDDFALQVSLNHAAPTHTDPHQQNAAGQERDTSNGFLDSPDPAAPTLAELDKVAWTTGYMASRFREALVNAYRSGKLREVGDGEVVVPREPTEAMLAAAEKEWRKGCLNPTIHVWDAMLAAKDAS